MKFNQSLLFAALLSSTLVLTACNDKETAKTPESKPSTQQTQPKEGVKAAEAAETTKANVAKEETKTADPVSQKSLAEFNKAVKINATSYNVVRDDQSNEGVAATYKIENKTNKAIDSLHFSVVYSVNNTQLYIADLPIKFPTAVAPNGEETVTETTPLANLPQEVRNIVTNPKNQIKVSIFAFSVGFKDGSGIVVAK